MPAEGPDRDAFFGDLAVERGYLTQAKLDEARAAQEAAATAAGLSISLAQVCLNKKLLTPDQAQDIEREVAVRTGEARLVAGYEVLAKIGQGGMGAVYKAKTDAGAVVALKILLPSLTTPEYIRRFERESKVVQGLNHANIVSCVEFGRDPKRGLYFCALEFVDGEDVNDRVERAGAMGEAEAVSITYQVAQALQHAYFNGLVHRDIKPENVKVTPEGTAKLLDLGLARPVSQEATRLTASGMFVGSVFYASPEQAKTEREIDIRSDIYSLGATLYYMVTGRPPFEGETTLAVLQAHVYEQIQWPAEVNPALSDGICRVIAKMMAKDPADRYQEPKELLYDLDMLKEGRAPAIPDGSLTNSSVALRGVRPRRARPPSAGRMPRAAERSPRRRRAKNEEERAKPSSIFGLPSSYLVFLGVGVAVFLAGAVAMLVRGGKPEKAPKPPTERGHAAGEDGRAPGVGGTGASGDGAPPGRSVSPEARVGDASVPGTRTDPADAAGSEHVPGGQPTVDTRKVSPPSPVEGDMEAHSRRVPTSSGKTLTLDLGGGVTMELVYIKPGVFMMGGERTREGRFDAVEVPKHTVTLTKGYYLGKYEVTQAQFQVVMGNNPSKSTRNPSCPVDHVAWFDATEFCRRAAEKTERKVRLPTEAEWEYACRAGTDTPWSHGSDPAKLGEHAWFDDNSGERSYPVGQKKPNPWGLYDMHGNVCERVADMYHRDYYAHSPKEDPTGAKGAVSRGYQGNNGTTILRGGTWTSGADECRSGARLRGGGQGVYHNWGFRVAVSSSPDDARRVPGAGLDALLAEFDSLMMKQEYAKARAWAEKRVRGTRTDSGTAESEHVPLLQAAARVAKALETRPAAIRKGAEALVGHEVRLRITTGAVFGKLKEVTDDKLVVATTYTINRQQREKPVDVPWKALHEDELARLAGEGGWNVGPPVRAVARAWVAFTSGDLDAAESAAKVAGDHPLAEYLKARVAKARVEAAYSAAMDRARARMGLRNWKGAVEALEEALAAKPEDAEATKLLAEAESHIGPAPTLTLDLGGNVTMEFVYVKPGRFVMGSNEEKRYDWQGVEKPKHDVAITRGFYIGKYEVTQAQYEAVMGVNPSKWKEAGRPVEQVTWTDAAEFCHRASEKTRREVRLPTEAEWEYACRAGTTMDWSHGSDAATLGEYAWYNANAGGQTHAVGQKKPSAWGLHDMHGNVWEWVADWYDAGYYALSPREDPVGPAGGKERLLRGGGWINVNYACRSACRAPRHPSDRYISKGFRAAVSSPPRGR